MAQPGLAARRAALALVGQVTGERRPLSDVLPGIVAPLDPPDRARAQRLALECLRWMARADRLLSPHLQKRPPLKAMNALRLAVVEMAVEGAPAHGVVDAAVRLVKADRKIARLSGLVNAVLRRADIARWPDLSVPKLPTPLRAALVEAWGAAAVAAMEAAHAAGAPLDLTPRDDGEAAALAETLDAELLPTGSLRIHGPAQVSALPGYAEGAFWVQDAAAALPARALATARGERVADLCAAPGGKTLQLAATGAAVTAVDSSASRMVRLAENLQRTGLRAESVIGDVRDWDAGPFDAVLLDAPCSATGTIRRHPDLPIVRPEPPPADLLALQARLLDAAAALLRPGGRLVYATCSLLPAEGEAQIGPALERNPSLAPDLGALRLPGVDPGWIGPAGLRLRSDHWPARGGMDGFFVAAFRKRT